VLLESDVDGLKLRMAPEPIATDPAPVIFASSDAYPIAVFPVPVVAAAAFDPTAVFWLFVLAAPSALLPTATESSPVVSASPAAFPMQVLRRLPL
jgi:hypothetical protein